MRTAPVRMLTIWLAAGFALATDWSIIATEVIESPPPQVDRQELDEYRASLLDRLDHHRARLPTAPAAAARLLREDIAFFLAELDRIGGRQVFETRYRISGDRIVVDGGFGRLVVDRAAGTARLDGVRGDSTLADLAPLPVPVQPWGEEAPPFADAPSFQVTVRAEGRTWTVRYAAGLPNPWALARLRNLGDDELPAQLAALPGLPWSAEAGPGGSSRRIDVIARPNGR